MATKLTLSTTLPNGNEVSKTLAWANDTKARRMLFLFAQSVDHDGQLKNATPAQQLAFVLNHIVSEIRQAAMAQYYANERSALRAAVEDEIGPEPE